MTVEGLVRRLSSQRLLVRVNRTDSPLERLAALSILKHLPHSAIARVHLTLSRASTPASVSNVSLCLRNTSLNLVPRCPWCCMCWLKAKAGAKVTPHT